MSRSLLTAILFFAAAALLLQFRPNHDVDLFWQVRLGQLAVERGELDREDNPLRNAPHTIEMVSADDWTHAYPRQQAAYPLPYLRRRKFWPPVARVDNPYGDRNLVCSCPPMEQYAEG